MEEPNIQEPREPPVNRDDRVHRFADQLRASRRRYRKSELQRLKITRHRISKPIAGAQRGSVHRPWPLHPDLSALEYAANASRHSSRAYPTSVSGNLTTKVRLRTSLVTAVVIAYGCGRRSRAWTLTTHPPRAGWDGTTSHRCPAHPQPGTAGQADSHRRDCQAQPTAPLNVGHTVRDLHTVAQ